MQYFERLKLQIFKATWFNKRQSIKNINYILTMLFVSDGSWVIDVWNFKRTESSRITCGANGLRKSELCDIFWGEIVDQTILAFASVAKNKNSTWTEGELSANIKGA